MSTGELLEQPETMLGSSLQRSSISSRGGGVSILLAASCHRKWRKAPASMGHLGLKKLTLPLSWGETYFKGFTGVSGSFFGFSSSARLAFFSSILKDKWKSPSVYLYSSINIDDEQESRRSTSIKKMCQRFSTTRY